MGVKLWHDDVRPPPDGSWVWVRTNTEAKEIMSRTVVDEASLDHDLGCEPEDGLYARGSSPAGTGLDLCRWMVDHDLVPRRVTVHSWNPAGAEAMCDALDDHCVVTREPYRVPA